MLWVWNRTNFILAMLKRTLILGIITACFVLNIGYANANTGATNWTSQEFITNNQTNSSTYIQQNLLPKDLIFKVVIGVFVEPLDIECNYLRKVRADLTIEETTEGRVRYAIGAFNSYQNAETYCENLKINGYQHARVLAYDQEKVLVMPMELVLELLESR